MSDRQKILRLSSFLFYHGDKNYVILSIHTRVYFLSNLNAIDKLFNLL